MLGPSNLGVQPVATIYSLFGFGGPAIVLLAADPTQGSGQDAPLASLGFLQAATSASLYFKSGVGVTNWTLISIP